VGSPTAGFCASESGWGHNSIPTPRYVQLVRGDRDLAVKALA
jgi:hypothetical protein